MPRPPVKKTRKLAKAQRLGELQAEIEHEMKTLTNTKHMQVSLKNHLGKIIDRIDPLETACVLALTVLIKNGLEWGETVFRSQVFEPNSIYRSLLRMATFGFITPFEPLVFPEIPEEVWQKVMDAPPMEMLQWTSSFVVAFMIVRHGDAMLEAGGSILGVAKGLMGALIAI